MSQRWVIGLAASSGGQGTDAALLELDDVGLDLRISRLTGLHQPHPSDLRSMIRRVEDEPGDARQAAQLHRLMGETFASAARALADSASVPLHRVQVIGIRGLSLGHEADGRLPTVLPLGMGAVVAERTGVTTLSDPACRDLAAGGAGAPLMALPSYLMFRHPARSRLLIHLGGMARLTYLSAGCRPGEVRGLEAGPCGVLLDALVRQVTGGKESCDAGGRHAVQGRCLEALLETWQAHPALQRHPPRSIPRQDWGNEFARRALERMKQLDGGLHDLLCTATHFVARTVASAARTYFPANVDEVLLTGWGARNGMLWRLLERHLDGVRIARSDEAGAPAELHQAAGAGILAALTVDGVPGNVPSATGAAGARLLGSLTPGSMANWARCVQWMASQTAPADSSPLAFAGV
jgi:anhydro-N-acetylmuramic acid kinase